MLNMQLLGLAYIAIGTIILAIFVGTFFIKILAIFVAISLISRGLRFLSGYPLSRHIQHWRGFFWHF